MSAQDSSAPTPFVVPYVGVNDDHVTIARICFPPGQRVTRGDTLFVVETSKATFDVPAPDDGYCWMLVNVGDEIAMGATAGYLTVSDVPPAAISGSAATKTATPRAPIATQPPAPATSGSDKGRLAPDFLAEIGRADSGFAQLSSDLKVMLYRRAGASIGDAVVFERGAAIYAEHIDIGAGCRFGANTVIRAETLRLGVGCLFGHDNDIMCRHIQVGDMLFLVNRVLIGQGGAFNEESALIVGHSCLISSDCLINTANRVTIGDVSCLSPRVSIYTHSHWQNILEGYSVNFSPVTIGNHVWVTGNCLVTPGAVMEDGSQALANSVIVGRVPARTIVAGVPATPLTTVRGQLSPAAKDHLIRAKVWPEVVRAIQHAGLNLADVAYTAHAPTAACPAAVQAGFGPTPDGYKGCYFDLTAYRVAGPLSPLVDEVRNVFRKHGIRFESHLWRYRADVGRFNA